VGGIVIFLVLISIKMPNGTERYYSAETTEGCLRTYGGITPIKAF